MKVKVKYILWFMILVPYFKPDSISGSMFAQAWNMWRYIAFIMAIVYIVSHYKRIVNLPKTSICLVLFYLCQIFATSINNLDVRYDVITFFRMSSFIIVVSIFVNEYGNCFIEFIYKILRMIIWINFFTVIIFFNQGISQDSYSTPIYFWSTKNHIISITITFLVIGIYLYNERILEKRRYMPDMIISTLATVLMGSSTAIISLGVLWLFISIGKYLDPKERLLNLRNALIVGVFLELLIVVFRIQEKFSYAIALFFGKDVTLTGRTDLWDQALELIKINWIYGNGDSYALSQYGWLTKTYWNSSTQKLEDTYFVAHNQFLEILLNGGVICFLPFIGAIIGIIGPVRKIKNETYRNMVGGALLAFLIVMISDLVYPYEMFFVFLIIASSIYKFEKKSTKEVYYYGRSENYSSNSCL